MSDDSNGICGVIHLIGAVVFFHVYGIYFQDWFIAGFSLFFGIANVVVAAIQLSTVFEDDFSRRSDTGE